MASVLVLLLVLAIFFAAAIYVIQLIPEPYQKWAKAVLVVVVAIILIVWLTGGGLGTVPPLLHK